MLNWILKFFRPHIVKIENKYYISSCAFNNQKEAEQRYNNYKEDLIKIL